MNEPSPECRVTAPMGHNCKYNYYYDPVCGCDGQTYYNSCLAGYTVRVEKQSPCDASLKKDTVTYLGEQRFAQKEGGVFNLKLKGDRYGDPYLSNSYGHFSSPYTNFKGKKFLLTYVVLGNPSEAYSEVYLEGSRIVGAACEDTFQPVCGSDGITYVNACYADYLKKTYVQGACPGSLGKDSLVFIGNLNFVKPAEDTISITKTHSYSDETYLYRSYRGVSDIGAKVEIPYIKAKDDYFEYYYFNQ